MHCVADGKETTITKGAAKAIASAAEQSSEKQNRQLIKMFTADIIAETISTLSYPNFELLQYARYNPALNSILLSVEKTPPRDC